MLRLVKLRAPNGVDVFVYIDKKTKLITRMNYAEEVDQFTNFKDVSGIKIAHTRQSGGQGRETKLELKAVDLDPKFDAKLFEKPTELPKPPEKAPEKPADKPAEKK